MDRENILQHVVLAVAQTQEASGRSSNGIEESTKPIGDVEGFDSLNGLEVTMALSQSLGYEIADDNLFVSKDGSRALSIAEMTDTICESLGAGVSTR